MPETATIEPVTDAPETEVVRLCLTGTGPEAESAFRSIYERHARAVYRFLERLLGDQESAEDALQETFVRLHRGLKSFDPTRPLRPFLFSVARNVAIDAIRARQKRPRPDALPPEQPAVASPDSSEAASRSERRKLVHDALAALAPEHRALLLLRHVEGQKLEEIADSSDCTVRTAYNRLRAASVLLERELKRRGVLGSEVIS